ncbi:tRNA selenocysteine 1-associated protein 1 [Amphibalanus amphitrite]|uniref:tRNA selenocysteine-associated protein 1 n=1 Tax=Amphibalanus amphitrite TaxID=1232801 RepID=A0A6A4WHA5_AMPAM|nr:tRNA selenocysteine 1-associated protein 1 [Amphibalanus amphitrite]
MAAYIGQNEGSLWMGDIADYMDANFITAAFAAMDETVSSVRHIKNKYNGSNAGYCFVHFKDKQTATRIMHKLNGKMIPNSQPPTRFMLNNSNAGRTGHEREYSIWVGDLDKSVDDSQLYLAFASRYSSVSAARVVMDRVTGVSRGYAFVRFSNEDDHKDSLVHMNGFNGLANRPIRVSLAVPRKPNAGQDGSAPMQGPPPAGGPNAGDGSDYNAYYNQYWYNYQAWQQNYAPYDASAGYQPQAYPGYDPAAQAAAAAPAVVAPTVAPVAVPAAAPADTSATAAQPEVGDAQEDDDQVVEHDVPADLEGQNREYVRRSEEFWDALDTSRWLQPDALNPALELFIKT